MDIAFLLQNLRRISAVMLGVATTTLLPAAPLSLAPEADTYVRNTSASSNFGTATTLVVNNMSGVRVGYLRFSLAGIPRPVTAASLNLTINTGATGHAFNVYGLAHGTAWSETSLTWNNAPGVVTSFVANSGLVGQFLDPARLHGNGVVLGSFVSAASGTQTVLDASYGPLLQFLNSANDTATFLITEPGADDASGSAWNTREAAAGKPALILSADPVAPPPTGPRLIRVVLLGGQSNADGRASSSSLPVTPVNYQATQSNVPFYFYTYGAAANEDGLLGTIDLLKPGATQMPVGGFGPEIGLGYTLSRELEQSPGTQLAILKYAKGGSSLHTDWKAGGNATTTGDGAHYQTFQRVVHNGLARLRAAYPTATVKLAAMVWVQGESDIDNGAAASAYATNLTSFINDIRATFDPGLPFVLSRISDRQTVYSAPADPDYPAYLTLRSQQALVAANVPAAYLVDTDGSRFTTNTDNLHFDAPGQLALGQALAARLIELLPLRVTSIGQESGGMRLRWNALPLRAYTVRFGSDLKTWTAVPVGAVGTWTDSTYNNQSVSRRFYRVEEQE